MRKRLRDEEDGVPFEYIKQVHDKHEERMTKPNSVDIIDVNDDFVEHESDWRDYCNSNVYFEQLKHIIIY